MPAGKMIPGLLRLSSRLLRLLGPPICRASFSPPSWLQYRNLTAGSQPSARKNPSTRISGFQAVQAILIWRAKSRKDFPSGKFFSCECLRENLVLRECRFLIPETPRLTIDRKTYCLREQFETMVQFQINGSDQESKAKRAANFSREDFRLGNLGGVKPRWRYEGAADLADRLALNGSAKSRKR